MRRITRGFTIIELLVVVSVIGILATIVLIGFNRYQADTRDSQRSSQATILAEGLEKYYDKNGEYPGCPAITGSASSVTTNVLPGVEQKTLVTPQDPNSETNSIKCQSLTPGGPDVFGYVGDGSSTCATGGSCLQFTLQYLDESTGTIKTITGRRNTNIATSGSVTDLLGSATNLTTANLTWGAIANASSYQIQEATDSGFTTGLVTMSATTTTLSVSGLVSGQLYYYRVAPVAPSTQGNWSNVISQRQPTLATPSVSAVANSFTTFTSSWASIQYAASYNVECSGDNTTWGSGCLASGVTGTSYMFYGATSGYTYYVRAQSVASGFTSSWSSSVAVTVPVATPTGVSIAANSSTQETVSWNAVSGASSYTLQYANNSGFSGATSITGITSISKAITSLPQGMPEYARVYAVAYGTSSSASSTVSWTTTISTPAAATFSVDSTTWATGSYHVVSYISYCPAGTSLNPGPDFQGGFGSSGFNAPGYALNFWHAWGFSDWWNRGSTVPYGSTVEYQTDYKCTTSYASSATSAVTYSIVTID